MMETFEIDMTTNQALQLWRERAPVTVRLGGVRATMAIESITQGLLGWSTVKFRRIAVA